MIGLGLAGMVALQSAAWGQSAIWLPQTASSGSIHYSGGNVGVGTSTPAANLHVAKTGFAQLKVGDDAASTAAGLNGFNFLNYSDGNNYFDSKTQSNGYTHFRIGHGSEAGWARVWMAVQASTGNVGIGTTNPQYKVTVEGAIGARDVIVTNQVWADYVFRAGYRLRPLSEVSQFIQANGHLPDIPTEAEVKEKGVSLGDMQAKLLAKVEELTLYMIQQEKENRELRESLTKENRELRERLARIEKGAPTGSTSAAVK